MSRTRTSKRSVPPRIPFRTGKLLAQEVDELRRRIVEYPNPKQAVDFYFTFLAEDDGFIESSRALSASKQAELLEAVMKLAGRSAVPAMSAWLELAEHRLWHGTLTSSESVAVAVYLEDLNLGVWAAVHQRSARIQMAKFSLPRAETAPLPTPRASEPDRSLPDLN